MSKAKVVQVNYWKRMLKETEKVIGGLHGLVLLSHNSIEFSDVVDFLNKVRKDKQSTVLYISLINSYKHIKKTLEKHPLHSKKLFVVDCVSGFVIEVRDTHDCIYRKPPYNLEQMKKMLMMNIERVNPNIVVIDSLSQFINLSMPREDELNEFYRFLRDIKQKVLGLSEDVIILLYNDKVGLLRALPVMTLDLVLKLEVIRDKVKWHE